MTAGISCKNRAELHQMCIRDSLLSPAPDMLDAELESYNLKADCDALRAQSAYAFEETRTGFLSRTDLARESLVFYSVPYDEDVYKRQV